MTKKKTKSTAAPAPIKKVAIIGSASSSKDLAPYGDPNFEFWYLAWRKDVPHGTRAFDLHAIDATRRRVPPNYKEHLASLTVPLYLQKRDESIPASIEYPLKEVTDMLGPKLDPYANGDYFCSSIAFMIALALYEGFQEIHLYGVDLIDDSEYAYQKPNTEYLLGVARGMGVKVYIPEQSSLLKFNFRYGYEEHPGDGIIKERFLKDQAAEYKMKADKAISEYHAFSGAEQAIRAVLTHYKHYSRGNKDEKS